MATGPADSRADSAIRLRGNLPLHELAVGEAMERAGELLRMDAQASPQSLKGDLRIRIMGQELEDLAVVVAQVVERLTRRRVHGGRYHGERTHTGGLP